MFPLSGVEVSRFLIRLILLLDVCGRQAESGKVAGVFCEVSFVRVGYFADALGCGACSCFHDLVDDSEEDGEREGNTADESTDFAYGLNPCEERSAEADEDEGGSEAYTHVAHGVREDEVHGGGFPSVWRVRLVTYTVSLL